MSKRESARKETEKWKDYWKTEVSKVGEHEILIRGYSLEEIIGNLSYTEVVFLTLRGKLPTENEAQMLDALLCSIVDHQFIASTTPAARFTASANPQLVAAVASGILTMGSNTVSPQGSANLINASYELMKKQGLTFEETAGRVVENYRKEKKRIPGFGHPVHKNYDPRARKLRMVAEKLGFVGEKTKLYEAIHAEFLKVVGKDIPINVDGMMACIMNELGFDPLEMVGVAALSFLPGIIAQVIEEIKEGVPLRIIPDLISKYTGLPKRSLPPKKIRV